MTINKQLNDTCVYQIIPTNCMCSMISVFRLKGPCSSVRAKKIDCRKVLSMKNIWINVKQNVSQNPCCVGSLLQYILI